MINNKGERRRSLPLEYKKGRWIDLRAPNLEEQDQQGLFHAPIVTQGNEERKGKGEGRKRLGKQQKKKASKGLRKRQDAPRGHHAGTPARLGTPMGTLRAHSACKHRRA